MPKLANSHGQEMHLGDLIGQGGEGAVFAIQGDHTKVAKIYLQDAGPQRAAKLATMITMTDPRLQLGAWPSDTLHQPNGKFVGFVMPNIEGHLALWLLYNPKMRLQHFPGRDWRFLFAAAANVARAFDAMHQTGVVVGDVNHSNLMVAQDATSRFIDCDSFQVTHGGKQFTCDVGTPDYQPPEMPDSYRGVPRTTSHDNFGLAILIFHLLFGGRHPFSGVFQGIGEPPQLETAIKQSLYAYGNGCTLLRPSEHSLPISALPANIINLFESAFSPTTVRGGRPSASDWVMALRSVAPTLRQCSNNSAHYYHWNHCHWCDLEVKSGATLFEVPAPQAQSPWIAGATAAPPRAAGKQRTRSSVPPIPKSPIQPTPAAPSTPPPAAQPIPQPAQTVAWQAGWAARKAINAHPAAATIGGLFGGIWLLAAIINAISPVPQQIVVQPPAQSAPVITQPRVAESAPPPVVTPPVQVPAPPPVIAAPPPPPPVAAPVIPPPSTLYQPKLPVQPTPQIQSTPQIQPSVVLPSQPGPSYHCGKADTPLTKFICADAELSWIDLEMAQPYYVLRQIVGQTGWKDLLIEVANFQNTAQSNCGVADSGELPADLAALKTCLSIAYRKQRSVSLAKLEGDGLEEATRDIDHHIVLQGKLQSLGYLRATDKIDGVYGTDTRIAIVNWQTASSLPPTGLLSDREVSILLQSPPMVPTPQTVAEAAAFADGLRDRGVWESWFSDATGPFREGADYWASHRSLPHPSCTALKSDAITGCMTAAGKLAPYDARRKADPAYRRGWNEY